MKLHRFFWSKTKQFLQPDYWKEYLTLFQQLKSRKTPVQEIRFVAWDTETNGLNPKTDQLLSIGALRIKNRQIQIADSFECHIIRESVTAQSIPIHGIRKADLWDGLTEEEAVSQFIHYCGDSILVAHNAWFDCAVINRVLDRLVHDKIRNPVLDTARLAYRLEKMDNPYSVQNHSFELDALCERYDVPLHDRHTSAGDAMITALLFLKLLSRMEARGLKTLGDLLR